MPTRLAVIRPLSHFHLWLNSLEKYSCFESVKCISTSQNGKRSPLQLKNRVSVIYLSTRPAYFFDFTRIFGRPRLTSWAFLDGLENAASDMDVFDSGELFTFSTRQCALFCKARNKPLIVSTIETIPNHILTRLPPYSNNVNLIANYGDLFIVPTHRSMNYLLSVGIEKHRIRVIRQGVDLEVFKVSNSKQTRRVRFLIVSALISRRGIIELLEAFKKLVDGGDSNVELWICGDGSLTAVVREFKQRYPIKLLGRVPYSELPDIYSACDVFCMPGKDLYKFGLKILEDGQYTISVIEAMACGLPLIVSDSGAYPEMVGSENFVVRQGSVIELFQCMRDLSRDSSLRETLVDKNRKRAERFFDARKQLQEYYNEVRKLV